MSSFFRFIVITVISSCLLMACSSAPKYKGVYEAGEEEKAKLDVPPDLSQPVATDETALPIVSFSGSTYSTLSSDKTAEEKQILAPLGNDVYQMQRDGGMRWLEVRMPAERVWQDTKTFFERLGFKIEKHDKNIGVFETSWQENRVNLPTNWLSKLLKKLYSSGLMDRYRVRIESTDKSGYVLLFISHQGLKEIASNESKGFDSNIETAWVPRESDAELEFEMLQRFMLFQGADEKAIEAIAGKDKPVERTSLVSREDGKVLRVEEAFPRTWRRVGIALDRMGLQVDDKNRSSGLYYIRISKEFRDRELAQEGWFAKLFSSKPENVDQQYLINIKDLGQQSEISIYLAQGGKPQQDVLDTLYARLELYLK